MLILPDYLLTRLKIVTFLASKGFYKKAAHTQQTFVGLEDVLNTSSA